MASRKYSSVSQVENNEENQSTSDKYFANMYTLCDTDTSPKQRKYIGAVAIVGVVIIALITGNKFLPRLA